MAVWRLATILMLGVVLGYAPAPLWAFGQSADSDVMSEVAPVPAPSTMPPGQRVTAAPETDKFDPPLPPAKTVTKKQKKKTRLVLPQAQSGQVIGDVTALSCPEPNDAPKITIKTQISPPLIDHNRSQYNLEDFETSGTSPYGADSYTKVQGLMRGTIKVESNMTIGWRTNTSEAQNCYWYQNILVILSQAPIIYVAKEIEKDSCKYKEVIKHEKKHVAIDNQLLDEYTKIYKKSLNDLVDNVGIKGPYPSVMHDQAQAMLKSVIADEIKKIHGAMRIERMRRQNGVDTLEEYERVNNACVEEQMRLENKVAE